MKCYDYLEFKYLTTQNEYVKNEKKIITIYFTLGNVGTYSTYSTH